MLAHSLVRLFLGMGGPLAASPVPEPGIQEPESQASTRAPDLSA